MKSKHFHLLVEIGLIASAGGAHNGVQKGGGLHSGKVQPEFRQLSIADNKRRRSEQRRVLHRGSQ